MLPPDALHPVSFTDGTSLPFSGAAIDAQVMTGSDLDWLRTIVRLFPVAPGSELKFANIPEQLFSLASNEQQRVLRTLKTVRINVNDPRLYIASVGEKIAAMLPDGDYKGFLARLAQREREAARQIESLRQRWIATKMLEESPAERIKRGHELWEYRSGLRILGARRLARVTPFEDYEEPEEQIDLSPFEHRKASMVNMLSKFLSMSASVFLVDGLTASADSADAVSFLHPWQVSLALHDSHAFDEGDAQAIAWIRRQRAEVLSKIHRHLPSPFYSIPGALVEVGSKDSLLTQGADVAAGVVRYLWARHGLQRVAATFDHVTYNAKRISETDAATIQQRLSALYN